jgi:Flp pilus assembly CpaF family ATPase
MLRNTQTTNKNILIVGGYGSGKTTTAIELMGNRPHVILPANEITINDIYSYPKHHGLIIEDVHYKPDKDKKRITKE